MKAFGDPQKGQKYIHIGGTNGKGSVAAFLASVLKEAGLRVGFYSSPHLVRFTERFKINDREISPERCIDLIQRLKSVMNEDEPPTFFEATTAMALLYFAEENTDIAIMEVGMGGRLDATNIITPLVSVITNISLEHQDFLGNRLLDIAGEKGGIIKNGVDLVTAVTQPAVIDLYRSICAEKEAPFYRLGNDFNYRSARNGLHFFGKNYRLKNLGLGLRGKFQSRNAALAMCVIERLGAKGIKVFEKDIRDGLRNTTWPGRMHIISKEPTILVDGSHNPAAIKTLAVSIEREFKYERLILVIGVMEDKAIGPILRAIVPLSDYAFFTKPAYYRAANPESLLKEAASLKRPGEVAGNLYEAIDKAREMADPRDLIVICGSLFTAGETLTYFDPVTYRPDNI
jgi:dihydrofolate synthase/folylpolyglutamate synthase